MPDISAPAVPGTASASEEKLAYRLFTGADDRAFCERVSAALAEGYVLHGSPAATFNGSTVIVAQALVLPSAIASADAAVANAVDDLDTGEFGEEEAFEGHA
ncbi:DUF1737 domain-containing protein [Arthrobacter sp. PM3]|uniref:DUF1737 domain-containing protein n=1 Tax=Arthrobacter sp. PM3 TaxID=2017685 RepID=UPI0021C3D9D0|nr:DUF1737 domain-containing protein [Arthrobacter sp. PM3]